jgi:hypothetical protein
MRPPWAYRLVDAFWTMERLENIELVAARHSIGGAASLVILSNIIVT